MIKSDISGIGPWANLMSSLHRHAQGACPVLRHVAGLFPDGILED